MYYRKEITYDKNIAKVTEQFDSYHDSKWRAVVLTLMFYGPGAPPTIPYTQHPTSWLGTSKAKDLLVPLQKDLI